MRSGLAVVGLTLSMVVAVGDGGDRAATGSGRREGAPAGSRGTDRPERTEPDRHQPALAFMPDMAGVDIEGIRRARAARLAAQRPAAGATAGKDAKPYPEREPVGTRGRNDTDATAESLPGLGTAPGFASKAALSGDLAADPGTRTLPPFAEDNGSIPLAAPAGAVAGSRPVA
ncbi:hypothetical protein [Kibdelosporangium phytohabitans]|uniref:Uncharacterized protein n=1 Tax=Kibdelosporangium phytohabitans TaxID=860235 RepID=A0A0N9IAA1_9PSEU|nr:hypothetical protein [Kibdelosporangium phytohabitans]ALG11373.1 hypothetical protein AOZ06_34915 [Kibdelosporangium phytohabitans]MBE1462697.1 hypothetical protein [Kibdelosporangium phytohabitans]